MHIHTYRYIHAYIDNNIHTHTYIHYIHYTFIHTYIYIRTYIHTYIRIHIYIDTRHTYIHTAIHTIHKRNLYAFPLGGGLGEGQKRVLIHAKKMSGKYA